MTPEEADRFFPRELVDAITSKNWTAPGFEALTPFVGYVDGRLFLRSFAPYFFRVWQQQQSSATRS